MKHPDLVRDRVAVRVRDMLEHLRIHLSMLPDPDLDVLRKLEQPQQFEEAVAVANFVMARLGHPTGTQEPRFDKIRRVLRKKRGRPPRGEKLAGEPKPEDAEVAHV